MVDASDKFQIIRSVYAQVISVKRKKKKKKKLRLLKTQFLKLRVFVLLALCVISMRGEVKKVALNRKKDKKG